MKIWHIMHFMKIEIRLQIGIPMCNCAAEKIKAIGCLVPELQSKMHNRCGTQLCKKTQSSLSHIQMLAHRNVHSFHTGFIKDSQISELTFVSSYFLCPSHTTNEWLSLPLSPLSNWLKSPTCLKPLVVKQLSNLSSGYPELKETYLDSLL